MSLSSLPPLRDDVATILKGAQDLVRWIALRQDNLEIKSSDAVRVPGALLDLCIEHHVGIVHLLSSRINGPAFALVRVQFESLIRALWLQTCATREELRRFIENDCLSLKVGQMIDAIEKHSDFSDKTLSCVKSKVLKSMNGYTHGGMHQVARRISARNIEPSYGPEEIIEVLKASGTFALMALLQIGRLAGNERVISDANERLRSCG